MLINFSEIKLFDMDGNELVKVHFYKTIANAIYCTAKTLDLVDTAIHINKGESVDLSKSELEEIKHIIADSRNGIFTYARKAAIQFIDLYLGKPSAKVLNGEVNKEEDE